jgi:hypothetical protein
MNTVEVQGKGVISIDSVEVGDYVRSSVDKAEFSIVYSLGHKDNDKEETYIQIYSADRQKPLEITPDHMMFLNSNVAVKASQVKVGDQIAGPEHADVITSIKTVTRRGGYAPLTESGDLVVSGARVSSYISPLDVVSPNIQQAMGHALFAPHRLLCSLKLDWCKKETHNEDGLSRWTSLPVLSFLTPLSKQHVIIQYFVLAVGTPLLAICYGIEQMIALARRFLISVLLMVGVIVYVKKMKLVPSKGKTV